MQQQNRAVPAPIFNARKRPRQAVIAEPQMPQMGPGPAGAAPYQGLMPPCGFPNQGHQQRQQHQQQQQQHQQQHHHQQQQRMSGRGDAGSSFRQNTNSTRPWNTNRTQNPSYGNSKTSSNSMQMNAAPPRYPGNQQYSQVPRQNSYEASLPEPRVQNTGGDPYGQTRSFNFNKQSRLQQPQMAESRHGTRGITLPGMSAGNAMYGHSGGPTNYPGGRYNATPSTSGQYTPAFANTTGDFDDDLADAMGFVPTQMLNNSTHNTTNTSVNSTSSTVAYNSQNGEKLPRVPAKKAAKAADMTRTAHLLTVRASGIKRWAKYRHTLQLIFEVFGYLDSAMGRSQSETKEFLLRDDAKESINCVFYEIDRPLVKMTRGQWYRVVGTYEPKTERLKCVSVRAMSETEKPLVQTLVDRSSQELARLTRHLREQ